MPVGVGMNQPTGRRGSEVLSPVIQRIADSMGLELVEWKWTGPTKRPILRVLVDKVGGVAIDECAAMSRTLSFELDLEADLKGRYTLEVGSPGLDRPLVVPADFRRKVGRKVVVSYMDAETVREVEGEIGEVTEEQVMIGETAIDFAHLRSGRLMF